MRNAERRRNNAAINQGFKTSTTMRVTCTSPIHTQPSDTRPTLTDTTEIVPMHTTIAYASTLKSGLEEKVLYFFSTKTFTPPVIAAVIATGLAICLIVFSLVRLCRRRRIKGAYSVDFNNDKMDSSIRSSNQIASSKLQSQSAMEAGRRTRLFPPSTSHVNPVRHHPNLWQNKSNPLEIDHQSNVSHPSEPRKQRKSTWIAKTGDADPVYPVMQLPPIKWSQRYSISSQSSPKIINCWVDRPYSSDPTESLSSSASRINWHCMASQYLPAVKSQIPFKQASIDEVTSDRSEYKPRYPSSLFTTYDVEFSEK